MSPSLAAPPAAPARYSRPHRRTGALPVATLLTPDERLRVDAAGQGLYATLHRETLDDLLRELRARPVSAVILSTATLAHCGGREAARVAELVRGFPQVPTVALVSEVDGTTPQTVLALGGSGVRRLVDTRRPDGWTALRDALAADEPIDLRQHVVATLAADLVGAPDGCLRFFAALFAAPPEVTTVRGLATLIGVLPTTLMSRFFRTRLPAPKRYLALARLVRAARMLENPGCTLTAAAHFLEYSSAQSFGRHVRKVLGLTPRELRRHWGGVALFDRFRAELVLPYRDALRRFSPYGR
ncbi:Helix-turn-helix, AraC domain-containing protein [Gemmatirosa kalamazoonensis]|uniref:Helix-turn-helix, AraC domain-containing protein n=1 Tax=Gemmatirosa kalamazoonensis TaxID=861299 RepID=W0RC63_9BACT|nr:helix-turn-helix domain-containing protein [Gemmatirosa kalamazoonensis]AHG88679.1 Helix-turn-helix, AraC domain-containing protein [Gemmatirosa kalamazoonensis]